MFYWVREREALDGWDQVDQVAVCLDDPCFVLLYEVIDIPVESSDMKIISSPELPSHNIVLPSDSLLQVPPMRHIDNTIQLKRHLMNQIEIDLNLKLFIPCHKARPIFLIMLVVFGLFLCELADHCEDVVVVLALLKLRLGLGLGLGLGRDWML